MTTGEILAIDIGSTAIKARRFNSDGSSAGEAVAVRHRQHSDVEAAGHVPAQRLLDATLKAIQSLPLDGVRVVATSTIWHALVALDRDNRPIGPALSWEASVPREIREEIEPRLAQTWSHHASGAYVHPSYSLVSLPVLAARRPHRISDIGSWLVSRVGGFLGSWPENIAAASGLWVQEERDWNGQAITALQVDPELIAEQWSQPRVATAPMVEGLTGATFLPPVGDGLCHNLGQHAVDGRVAVTVGTSGSVRAVTTGLPFHGPDHGLWRYRCDARTVATGGAITSAGNTLEWVSQLFGKPIPWGALTPDAVHSLPLADASVFGRRGPDYPWNASGSISHMTPNTRADDIALAWGLAVWRQFDRHLESLQKVNGDVDELVVEGGAIDADAAAAQVLADTLGRPMVRTTEPQPSLAGAALVGATYQHHGGFDIDGTVQLIRSGRYRRPSVRTFFEPRDALVTALHDRRSD